MQRWTSLCSAVLVMMVNFGPALAQQQTALAQPFDQNTIISAVLTIDSERLFLESAFGRRVAAEVEEKGNEIAAENRKIEAELEAEEQRLTDLRSTMGAEEFRVLANAFDERVQRSRTAQAAKGRALNELLEQEREVFLTAAAPVMEQLMREAGAAVILEQRSVFVSASAIEITDKAIALIDDTLGSGEGPQKP